MQQIFTILTNKIKNSKIDIKAKVELYDLIVLAQITHDREMNKQKYTYIADRLDRFIEMIGNE